MEVTENLSDIVNSVGHLYYASAAGAMSQPGAQRPKNQGGVHMRRMIAGARSSCDRMRGNSHHARRPRATATTLASSGSRHAQPVLVLDGLRPDASLQDRKPQYGGWTGGVDPK